MKTKPLFVRVLVFALFAGLAQAETLTLPLDQRPDWLEREGIVMAGSWEPLLFRVRRDGSDGYTPTPAQREAYLREHSPEMIVRLKELGVNFVMTHCYKGAGLGAERESMRDAVRFAKLCHEAGLRVGVYNYSGAFIWERLFKEVPEAKDWILLDQKGRPRQYGRASYRYYWNRNHPDAVAYYRGIVRFAIEDIRADLIHFDNYRYSAGYDPCSTSDFHRYLRQTFTDSQLEQAGVEDVSAVTPEAASGSNDLLRFAWQDFRCGYLADSYHDMSRYARSLRKDILVECNPGGVSAGRIRPPIDHGRLLRGGEAFWHEGGASGYRDGKLRHRILTYKAGRRMDNITFCYTTTPLEMAESMAFNRDCLGCVCWFEYGHLVDRPAGKEPMSPKLAPFIRFFHERRDLLRDAEVVADVALLRNFPSQVFGGPEYAGHAAEVEQTLIDHRVPFQIIYDHHLNDLGRYRALVLVGCVAMSDDQLDAVVRYVKSGGRLCVLGPFATQDEWTNPRDKPGLSYIPVGSAVDIYEAGGIIKALSKALGDKLSADVKAPAGLCAEFTAQRNRRLVHLVNYRPDRPARDIGVTLRLPADKRVTAVTLADPQRKPDVDVAFEQQGGAVKFTVPAVDTYAIAVVSFR